MRDLYRKVVVLSWIRLYYIRKWVTSIDPFNLFCKGCTSWQPNGYTVDGDCYCLSCAGRVKGYTK